MEWKRFLFTSPSCKIVLLDFMIKLILNTNLETVKINPGKQRFELLTAVLLRR
jgi:hypothetical protein